jgi:hypothetical protein
MKLVLPEKDVREAGQVVVLRQGALVTEMPVSE